MDDFQRQVLTQLRDHDQALHRLESNFLYHLNIPGALTADSLNLGTASAAGSGAISATSSQPTIILTKSSISYLEALDLYGNGNANAWRFLVDDSTGSGLGVAAALQIWYGPGAIVRLTTAGAMRVTAGFGCNAQAAQAAFASGGAVVPGAGAFGASSAALFANFVTLVTNIRTALVNNGIMS